jgi:hypothetical protein
MESDSMTVNEFRKLALTLPQAVESAHMGHPDFRVGGKIFATLWPGNEFGVVKLTPEQQTAFIGIKPDVFSPVNGAWGRKGATKVTLRVARKSILLDALTAAWRNTAPKKLVREFDAG